MFCLFFIRNIDINALEDSVSCFHWALSGKFSCFFCATSSVPYLTTTCNPLRPPRSERWWEHEGVQSAAERRGSFLRTAGPREHHWKACEDLGNDIGTARSEIGNWPSFSKKNRPLGSADVAALWWVWLEPQGCQWGKVPQYESSPRTGGHPLLTVAADQAKALLLPSLDKDGQNLVPFLENVGTRYYGSFTSY